MNHQKIGIFIKELRYEKNLTQKELAEKLNITDKAISKWETAKGIPDITLLESLSNVLEVSLTELLNGERVIKEQVEEKSNNAIVTTLEYSSNKIKKCRRYTLIFDLAGFLLVLSFLFLGDDSSWRSIYSIMALVFLCIGIFRACIKGRLIKSMLTFIIGISLFLLMDINNITQYKKPPIYVTSIVTKDSTIVYKSIFYNVYRYNKDTEDEYYYIDFQKKE